MRQVELIFGYEGGDGVKHTSVEIGRRVTGADLMRIGDMQESESDTQFNLMLLSAAITKFGTLPMPVPITVLLSLNRVDRDDLHRAHADFVEKDAAGRAAERLADNRLRLADGISLGGEKYDVVEFGKLLTGYDELEAEGMTRWRREFYLLGQQISSLSRSGGGDPHRGPVELEPLGTLLDQDAYALITFAGDWRDSFRRRARAKVQPDGGGGSDVPAAPLQGDDRTRGADAQS